MKLLEQYKDSIALAKNQNIITDTSFKKALDNCFSVLAERDKIHGTHTFDSKPDITKEFYAALLSVTTEFVRRAYCKEDIQQYLSDDCGLSSSRVEMFLHDFYKHRLGIEMSLLNIGDSLPHITDVKWKIDYIMKSSTMDSSEGPLFRICLVTDKYDPETETKKMSTINFTCTSQELQDLVYKLKDSVRHCSTVTSRIL
ncbi:unnamed protein product [Phaedon cochleariae]|uniref:COMM domain-containing protein 3 n=1 Tax=Phaedon cochleariae TaxID=80249 RepID=A0A9N9X3F2_PHACE|nr:unnamed protein product [Phaedon cochleariae]